MGLYIMQTGGLFGDKGLFGMMGWTMKMILKGRMGFIPTFFKGGREFRRLFKTTGKGGVK
jgi:hypothetical protein